MKVWRRSSVTLNYAPCRLIHSLFVDDGTLCLLFSQSTFTTYQSDKKSLRLPFPSFLCRFGHRDHREIYFHFVFRTVIYFQFLCLNYYDSYGALQRWRLRGCLLHFCSSFFYIRHCFRSTCVSIYRAAPFLPLLHTLAFWTEPKQKLMSYATNVSGYSKLAETVTCSFIQILLAQ